MLVFFISFILYLFTLFPGVAPYRDTGEMVCVGHTLGIAHPPGYPLYAMLSKIFLTILPFGSAGYRLNVLSALAGACTVWFFYRIVVSFIKNNYLAVLVSLVFATSYLQWYLALVSEMYTLNTLFAVAVLFILFLIARDSERATQRYYYLLVFLFAIGLGNRMDLLLFGAGLGWFFYKRRAFFTFRDMIVLGSLFLLGYSVYFFLLVRSSAGAFLDWNHPGDFDNFWGSITRKTHGGTLDLLSVNYKAGENFWTTIRFYAAHLFEGFAFAGVVLGVTGVHAFYKENKTLAVATFLAWLVSGPYFIYLANMPPNTHALAILEAHFLLPNVIFALWIAFGVLFFLNRLPRRAAPLLGTIALASMVVVNAVNHFPQLNKRNNFIAYDYTKNVLRSLPQDSIVIMKEDVQLFSLWNKQLVENQRLDVAVVSQGLSGSLWYQKEWKKIQPGVSLGAVKTTEEWSVFIANNPRSIYFTGDIDYPGVSGYTEEPWGLTNKMTRTNEPMHADTLLNHIYPYRGTYQYRAYREFFTPDLIDEYAKAYLYLGQSFMGKREYAKARLNFKKGLAMQPLLPRAANYSAFSYYDEGKYDLAVIEYREAVRQYDEMLALAAAFNSLSATVISFKAEASDMLVSLGVCYEKMNKDTESLDAYQRAIEYAPGNAKAYFNKSVIYWKRGDWAGVIYELEKALRINPDYQEARYYLEQAKVNRKTN